MSSRILIGGRPYFVSGVTQRERAAPKSDPNIVDKKNEDALTKLEIKHETTFVEDEKTKIKFPIVDTLQPETDWVSAHTIMAWYSANYDMIAQWIRDGWISCAILRGTSARKYRVLKPKELLDDKVRRALKRRK